MPSRRLCCALRVCNSALGHALGARGSGLRPYVFYVREVAIYYYYLSSRHSCYTILLDVSNDASKCQHQSVQPRGVRRCTVQDRSIITSCNFFP